MQELKTNDFIFFWIVERFELVTHPGMLIGVVAS